MVKEPVDIIMEPLRIMREDMSELRVDVKTMKDGLQPAEFARRVAKLEKTK